MTEQHEAEVEKTDDEEYADAYGFWIFLFGGGGAVAGYLAGSEMGFSFWPNLGFALLGFILLSSLAYRFRKIIAVAGAVLIVIVIIAAVVEGMLTA